MVLHIEVSLHLTHPQLPVVLIESTNLCSHVFLCFLSHCLRDTLAVRNPLESHQNVLLKFRNIPETTERYHKISLSF